MTLIDGDRIVTAQLYDDEHEEYTEAKMSIIDYVNMYTTEGVTTADDVLEQIRAEIEQLYTVDTVYEDVVAVDKTDVLQIIDKYTKEQTK